jgi:hypothetical protein
MADFKTAFLFTLQHEDSTRSGKVTVDAGGRTRFGIAEKFHPDLPAEFFTGPAEDALAEAEKIEEREYWGCMRLGEVENQNVANKLFDMGVNMECGRPQSMRNALQTHYRVPMPDLLKTARLARRRWRLSTAPIRLRITRRCAN